MSLDFTTVQDSESFVTIPPGTYRCRIREVREGFTRDGDQRWSLCFEVKDGEYAGRTAGWDTLSFGERGLPRVKAVLKRLGFDVSGTLELYPRELQEVEAWVTFVLEEREDPRSGRRVERLRVPYMGYEPCEEPDEGSAEVLG